MVQRSKKTGKSETEPSLNVLAEKRKLKAALALAHGGYDRNKKARTGAIVHAAREANVSTVTIKNWMNDDPDFWPAVEEIKHQLVHEALEGIRAAAKARNPVACMMLLKTVDPERFDDQLIRDRKRREHDKEMFLLKCAHEKEMLELQRAQPEEEDKEIPGFSFRVTLPGERIEPGEPNPEDEAAA